MTPDESIGLIAGGTGITPMLQVAQRIVENEHDATKVSLIFANVREEDILLRSKIEELAAAHPRQLKVYYVLDEPPEGWKGGKGYLTKEMLAAPPALHASAHHGAPALFPTGEPRRAHRDAADGATHTPTTAPHIRPRRRHLHAHDGAIFPRTDSVHESPPGLSLEGV